MAEGEQEPGKDRQKQQEQVKERLGDKEQAMQKAAESALPPHLFIPCCLLPSHGLVADKPGRACGGRQRRNTPGGVLSLFSLSLSLSPSLPLLPSLPPSLSTSVHSFFRVCFRYLSPTLFVPSLALVLLLLPFPPPVPRALSFRRTIQKEEDKGGREQTKGRDSKCENGRRRTRARERKTETEREGKREIGGDAESSRKCLAPPQLFIPCCFRPSHCLIPDKPGRACGARLKRSVLLSLSLSLCLVLSCPMLSCPLLSYPVLSCPLLSSPVLSSLSSPRLASPLLPSPPNTMLNNSLMNLFSVPQTKPM